MSDASAVSTDSSTFSETRIHNTRTLWIARLLWAVSTLAVFGTFIIGLVAFFKYTAPSCLCGSVFIGDDGTNVLVYPQSGGPAVGLIFDEDILIAVDGVRLPQPATRFDALRLTDYQQPGSPIVLTVRTGDGPERDVMLYRYFHPRSFPRDALWILDFIVLAVFAGVAFLIAFNRSDDWMALYTSFILLGFGLSTLSAYYYFGDHHRDLFILFNPLLWTILGVYPFLFPDGHPWRRWLPLFGVGYGMWIFLLTTRFVQINSILENIINLGFLTIVVLAWRASYLHRFTRLLRQQTKWVILGLSIVMFVRLISFTAIPIVDQLGYPEFGDVFANPIEIFNRLFILMIPLTFAFAALRYRLYDIDLVINRSLVYGVVTLGILALFGGGFLISYTLAHNLFGAQNAAIPLAVGTLISVVAFNRLRVSAQRFVDRRIFRLNFDLNQLAAAQKSPEIKNPGALTGKSLGGYQVLGVLGKGGMGEVYQGQANEQTVALKILPQDLAQQSEFISRFEREANTMRALNHDHIVKLLSSGEQEGVRYLALEYIEGTDLSSVLKERGKLSYAEACALLRDLASALDYAHTQGLVHRDIKPSNVMVRGDDPPRAVLMDFGIAKIKDAATRYTGSGAIGTIDYMAPEQIMAAKEVDKRADIYALGVMAYEMLTGEKPFKGSAAQVMFAHLQQPPPDARDAVADLPKNAAVAIQRAMSKIPQERFASAGDFALAL